MLLLLHTRLGRGAAYSTQIGKVIACAPELACAFNVKGGVAKLLDGFRAIIEKNGGEIRTGADVARAEVAKTVIARRACSPTDVEKMSVDLTGGDPCALEQFFLWRRIAGTPYISAPPPIPDRGSAADRVFRLRTG